jgi:sugar/nucleoside kinase (ribokinase family)
MFVIIGTANIDLIVSGFDQMPVVMGDEFTTSSLVFCDEPLQMLLGGNGANCAYVLAGLGAATTLCSAIGNDPLGRLVHDWLTTQGVDCRALLRHPSHATAFTTIVSDRVRNRLAFHHPGALAAYSSADLPPTLLHEANVFLVTGYTILPRFRPAGFAQMLAAARQAGAITALDIGPAIGQPAQIDELGPLLPGLDFLLTNRHELAVCTGESEPDAGAQRLLTAGAACVIVKQGREGALLCQPGLRVHVPAFAVEVATTVGAGDAFNAGLLFARSQGDTLEDAVRFGNAVAALVISSGRGILGCPALASVHEFVRRMAYSCE